MKKLLSVSMGGFILNFVFFGSVLAQSGALGKVSDNLIYKILSPILLILFSMLIIGSLFYFIKYVFRGKSDSGIVSSNLGTVVFVLFLAISFLGLSVLIKNTFFDNSDNTKFYYPKDFKPSIIK